MSDFGEFMRHVIESEEGKRIEKYDSQEEARKDLEKFLDKTSEYDFQVGDYVERNAYGTKRYMLPKENQVMRVDKILDKGHEDDKEDFVDVLVTVTIGKGIFKSFYVNGRYYQKAGSEKNVTFLNKFKGK